MTGSAREFTWMALPDTFFTFSVGFSLGAVGARTLHVSQSLSALLPHAPIIALGSLFFGSRQGRPRDPFSPRPKSWRKTLPAVHREVALWLRHQAVLWWVTTHRFMELCSQRI